MNNNTRIFFADKQNKLVLLATICYFIFLITLAVTTNGTCDSGDSISHFLFSKYAFKHPQNFIDHWAKPLFVLLSAPFAQMEFVGIKLFNCLVATFTIWITYLSAKKLNFKNAWLAPLLLAFTGGYIIHIESGLTEPLFAFVLMLSIYFLLDKRLSISICIISFLPFVRSEGLVIIGIFAFYLIFHKHYKYILMLFIGHLVYSFAGAFYYKDLFWVFTKIPYSGTSQYGSGDLSQFVYQLFYIIGVPLYILFLIGLIKKTVQLFFQKQNFSSTFFSAETMIIYGSFFSFFSAHTLFWYFGIFGSMGLNRVLISIVPLSAIIAVIGINFIQELIQQKTIANLLVALFIIYVIIFPFVPNPASVNWKKDFALSQSEKLIEEASVYLKNNFPENTFMFYSHPYISIAMQRDPFDTAKNKALTNFENQQPSKNYLIIWDNWFSVIENGVSLEQLKANKNLQLLKTFETNENGQLCEIVIFEKK